MAQHSDEERVNAPDSTILLPNPFSNVSRPTIDLTSTPSEEIPSTKSSHVSGSTLRQTSRNETGRPTPHTKAADGISPDELRLIGDFTNPADRVLAPDPASYFQKKPPMSSKPTSSRSFKPVNTLDVNRGPQNGRPVTYGKKTGRIPQNSIGHRQGSGQAQYRARKHENDSRGFKDTSRRSNDAPAFKKAKRDHQPEIIDLSDEDHGDAEELVSHHFADKLSVSRSSHTIFANSRSQVHAGTVTPFQRPSEFAQTNTLATTSQKRSPAKDRTLGQPSRRSLEYRRSDSPRPQSLVVRRNSENGRLRPVQNSTRRAILGEIQQGEQNSESDLVDVVSKHKSPRASSFPKGRINESTEAETLADVTVAASATCKSANLRDFRRASPEGADEVSFNSGRPLAVHGEREATIKAARSHNQISRARNRRPAAQGNPLVVARSYDFECRSEDVIWFLRRSEASRDLWTVCTYSGENQNLKVGGSMSTDKVNRGLTDNIKRVRLEGSRQSSGVIAMFDLEFLDHSDLQQFLVELDDHSIRMSTWTEQQMDNLFAKPLQQIRKSEFSPTVKPQANAANGAQAERHSRRTGTLLSQLPANTSLQLSAASEPDSSRSLRSTRHHAPVYDEERSSPESKVEKYSITVGLGTRWKGTLSYGEGRQRATVNFDDLQRLDEEEFLNDNLIEFYMIYLFRQHKVSPDKIFFFNTYFYSQLTKSTRRGENINYEAVKRWTSKVDIFNYDYIVVPINELTHWYLAIICNVGNIQRKPAELDAHSEKFAEATPPLGDEAEPQLMVQNSQEEETVAASLPEQEKAEAWSRDVASDITNPHLELDEEAASELNLINAEAVENSPQANGDILEGTEVGETLPTTVLSNLKASPVRKKTKRRSFIPKKDPEQPIIIVLDSLSGTRSPAVRALKEWLAAEGVDKRGMEAVIKEKGFYPKASHIPVQQNFSDCGVYLLGYVDKFFEDPDTFRTKLLTGEMTSADDWPNLQPKMMRANLRDIIFNLAAEQKLTEKPRKLKKTVPTTATQAKYASVGTPLQIVESQSTANAVREPLPQSIHGKKQEADPAAKTAPLNQPLLDDIKPRLGSPIRLFEESARNPCSEHGGHNETLRQVGQDEVSNVQNHAQTQKQFTAPRMSPVVLIPPRSTRAQEENGAENDNDDDDDMLFNNETTTLTASSSPSMTRMLPNDVDNEDGPESTPLVVQATLPVGFFPARQTFKQVMASKAHTCMGSEDDPIELEDSQERRASPSTSGSKTAEGVLQHKTDDNLTSPGKSRSAPIVLNRDISDQMDIDTEEMITSSTTSQDVEMKDNENTIHETPPSRRSSPPADWQTGKSLPM